MGTRIVIAGSLTSRNRVYGVSHTGPGREIPLVHLVPILHFAELSARVLVPEYQ